MMNSLMRRALVLLALSLAVIPLGFSGLSWKADSRALIAEPSAVEDLATSVDANTALRRLVAGNRRWRGIMRSRNWAAERRRTAHQQQPYAAVVACMDSRVSPDLIFDQGLGEIFVIRVAGPVMNNDELASLEYAIAKIKVKLVVVLGHTDCGAVKGAVDRATGRYLPELLEKIEPAITWVSDEYNDRRRITSDNKRNLNRVSLANARLMQPMIPNFDEAGVKVTWGIYYTDNGYVALEPRDADR